MPITNKKKSKKILNNMLEKGFVDGFLSGV
jgi:hypothetical protein